MMVMSPKPLQVRKLCLSKVTALLIFGPRWRNWKTRVPPKSKLFFFCLLVPKGKLSSHDEKKATHVFIDSFDDAEKQNLDSFWLALLAPSISAVVRRWGRRFRSSWTDWALTQGAGKHRCAGWSNMAMDNSPKTANFPVKILKPLFIGFYTVGYFPAINVLVPNGICHDDAAAILIMATVVLKIVHATEDDSVDDGHFGYIRYTLIYCIIYTRPLNVTLWIFFSCLTPWRRSLR